MRMIEFVTPYGQRLKVLRDRVDAIGETRTENDVATWLYMRGGAQHIVAGSIDTVAAALDFDGVDGPILRETQVPAAIARRSIEGLRVQLADGPARMPGTLVPISDEIDPWPAGIAPREPRPSSYEEARLAKVRAETDLIRARLERLRGPGSTPPSVESAGWFKGPQDFDAGRIEIADLVALRGLALGGTIECPMGFDRTFQARQVFTVLVGDGLNAWQAEIGREALVNVQRSFGLHWNGRDRVALMPFSGRERLVAALRGAGHYVSEAEPVAQDPAGAA